MKADLHVHTCYSNDGRTTPEELVEYAVANGIGCVAVTDHNSFEAYDVLKDNGKVIIIPAEEVSSSEGHIVALGIDRLIPRGLSIQETIDRIHREAGSLKQILADTSGSQNLTATATFYTTWIIPAMEGLRAAVDSLEMMMGREFWPFPTYGDLMFTN